MSIDSLPEYFGQNILANKSEKENVMHHFMYILMLTVFLNVG